MFKFVLVGHIRQPKILLRHGKHASLPTDSYTDEELKAVHHSRMRHWDMLFKRLNKATVEYQKSKEAMVQRGLL